MKKVILFAAASLFVLASCKKDYTCTCKANGTEATGTYNGAKKKDAEKACDDAETALKSQDSAASCTLAAK